MLAHSIHQKSSPRKKKDRWRKVDASNKSSLSFLPLPPFFVLPKRGQNSLHPHQDLWTTGVIRSSSSASFPFGHFFSAKHFSGRA